MTYRSDREITLSTGTVVAMRAPRVRDELRALEDFRVYLWPERLRDVLLARVITRFGARDSVAVERLAELAEDDIAALERAYLDLERGFEDGGRDGAR